MNYLNTIVIGAALLVAATASLADPEAPDKRTSVFGVTVIGQSPILTKKLVQAASDAASAYGIPKQHTIEAIDGIKLGKGFDSTALNEVEKAQLLRRDSPDLQPTYIIASS